MIQRYSWVADSSADAFAGIIIFLFVFAGLMSGLTLGLMSLGLVDLEVLRRSGTDKEKQQAGKLEDRSNLRRGISNLRKCDLIWCHCTQSAAAAA